MTMIRNTGTLSRLLVLALVPALGACRGDDAALEDLDTPPAAEAPGESLRVSEVDLGSMIGPDRRIADADDTDEFAPTDTIYASVETEGTGSASTLTARWTFEDGQVIDESSQTISPTGPAVTEFHISMPDGLPPGEYQVEILLNGTSVERREFQIEGS
jgi:hypothetical protein